MSIRTDKFLSDVMGYSVFESENIFYDQWTLDSSSYQDFFPIFVYSKANADEIDKINVLEKRKFNLIDMNVRLEKEKKKYGLSGYANIRVARQEDREQVLGIARTSFEYSRFHLDPKIPDRIANEIKRRWADNYFIDQRGDLMYVATTGNKILGFLLLIYKGDNLVIDLIAVLDRYRRHGIGRCLIDWAEKNVNDFSKVIVSTQAANMESLRFYQKSGFRVTNFEYIFHYHKS